MVMKMNKISVFGENENLTWKDVASSSGAGEARYSFRSQSTSRAANQRSSSVRRLVDKDEGDFEEDSEEEIEFVEKDHPNSGYDDDFVISYDEDDTYKSEFSSTPL
ncbi:hypothetical protein OROGR_020704 [Orobanche gracilis]